MKTPSYQVVPLRWCTSDGNPVCLESRLASSVVGIRLKSGLDSLHTSIVRIVNPTGSSHLLTVDVPRSRTCKMLAGSGRRRLDDSDQTILFESFCKREVMVSGEERADIVSC